MDKTYICSQTKVKTLLVFFLSSSLIFLLFDFNLIILFSTIFFLILTILFFKMKKKYVIIDNKICEITFNKEIYSINISEIYEASYCKNALGEKSLKISSKSIEFINGKEVENIKTLNISTNVTNFNNLANIIENHKKIR